MKYLTPIAAVAALALAACGTSDDPGVPDGDAASPAAAAQNVPQDAATPASAQSFVDAASASDLYEVEAGKLAQTMGRSQAVKDFGKMMETDHTKSTADLKAAAAQVNGVTVAPQLDSKQQGDLDALRAAGETFDATYKTQQIAAHTQALNLLRTFATTGDAQPLKDFAAQTAPVVEGHLKQAGMLP